MKNLFQLGMMLGALAISSSAFAQDVSTFSGEGPRSLPGQVIVDAKDNLSQVEMDELARDYGFSVIETSGLFSSTKEEIVAVDSDQEDVVLDRMSHDARIEIAEPLGMVYASMIPNDPKFKEQWHMERVNAPTAWDFATGRGITVAVIDTGVACENRDGFHKITDLEQTDCVPGWNFVGRNDNAADDHGHGTHVSGTIAQSTNNGVGVTGLAFHARIMPVKVLAAQGGGTTLDVANGIRWAADHGANVINMSLGGGPDSAVMVKAIAYAREKGVTVVAAAGNSGGHVEYPGGSKGVVGVAATDEKDLLAKFSCRGEGIDIAAPGTNVMQQTICKGGREKCEQYVAWNGTSMASPHVAGVAAMIESLGVTDPDSVEAYLRDSTRKVETSDRNLYGSGLLDAAAAVKMVTMRHAMWRLLALFGLMLYVGYSARKLNRNSQSTLNWKFILGAMLAGPGLFFFAPWLLSRSELVVDLLSRPIADLDLAILGQSVHRWLPLASALLPFGLTTVLFGSKSGRAFAAGISVGTAAYLVAAIRLGELASPIGHAATIVWLGANALGCLWIARENLTGKNSTDSTDTTVTTAK